MLAFHGRLVLDMITNMPNIGTQELLLVAFLLQLLRIRRFLPRGLLKWFPENLVSWTHQSSGRMISPLAIWILYPNKDYVLARNSSLAAIRLCHGNAPVLILLENSPSS